MKILLNLNTILDTNHHSGLPFMGKDGFFNFELATQQYLSSLSSEFDLEFIITYCSIKDVDTSKLVKVFNSRGIKTNSIFILNLVDERVDAIEKWIKINPNEDIIILDNFEKSLEINKRGEYFKIDQNGIALNDKFSIIGRIRNCNSYLQSILSGKQMLTRKVHYNIEVLKIDKPELISPEYQTNFFDYLGDCAVRLGTGKHVEYYYDDSDEYGVKPIKVCFRVS